MKLILHCALLVLYLAVTSSSVYTNLKNNVQHFLNKRSDLPKESLRTGAEINLGIFKAGRDSPEYSDADDRELKMEVDPKQPDESREAKYGKWKRELSNVATKKPVYLAKMLRSNLKEDGESEVTFQKRMLADMKDVEDAQSKIRILKKAKNIEDKLNNHNVNARDIHIESEDVNRQRFHMDPVLNLLRSQNHRRAGSDSDSATSSSRELKDWKDEWREHWMLKKFEALNSSVPRGDVVNMVAARPWGVPCGDPNQHDMPWGSCMLSSECESEYRIYRGDYFCGRSSFVCCALQLTNYDLYQGFDVSFDDKSMSTDTEEKKAAGKGSHERKKKHRDKEKKKRQTERNKRKNKIKKNIKKIIKEIRKILNKAYRNGTSQRKKKTKLLKRFIKNLKKQYKKDRLSVKQIHGVAMIKIDAALQQRLNEISAVNQEFMRNDTFREIIVNGAITKQGARMLVEAYPELSQFLRFRRSGSGPLWEVPKEPVNLEYDLEYGLLYY